MCPIALSYHLLFPVYRCSNSEVRLAEESEAVFYQGLSHADCESEMDKTALNFLTTPEDRAFMSPCHFEACFRIMHFCVEAVCTLPSPL